MAPDLDSPHIEVTAELRRVPLFNLDKDELLFPRKVVAGSGTLILLVVLPIIVVRPWASAPKSSAR